MLSVIQLIWGISSVIFAQIPLFKLAGLNTAKVCYYLPSCRSLRAAASSRVIELGNVTLLLWVFFFLSALALDPRAASFSICAHAFSCWARRFWACFSLSVAPRRPIVAISASSSPWSVAIASGCTTTLQFVSVSRWCEGNKSFQWFRVQVFTKAPPSLCQT